MIRNCELSVDEGPIDLRESLEGVDKGLLLSRAVEGLDAFSFSGGIRVVVPRSSDSMTSIISMIRFQKGGKSRFCPP